MSTMSLSRRQRRQMKRLGDEANRAVEGNRRFFDRWPGRTYRTRLASSAERQQIEIVQGGPIWAGGDQAVFVVMKQLAAGVRMKATAIGPRESIGEELSECHTMRDTASRPAGAGRGAADGGPTRDWTQRWPRSNGGTCAE